MVTETQDTQEIQDVQEPEILSFTYTGEACVSPELIFSAKCFSTQRVSLLLLLLFLPPSPSVLPSRHFPSTAFV